MKSEKACATIFYTFVTTFREPHAQSPQFRSHNSVQLSADNWKHCNSLVPASSSKAQPVDKIIGDHYLLSYKKQELEKIMEKAPWSHDTPFSYDT